MVKPTRTVRRTAGPRNTSRAAGAPAPASAAATAPAFYDSQPAEGVDLRPADEPLSSQLASFRETVRDSAVPLESGGSVDREVAEHMAEEAIEDRSDLAAEIERIRSIRKPLGAFSQKLALPQRPGYHRHWFNDVAGRIEEAEANGWTHVKGKDGKPIARCVGTGRDKGSLYAYAMEIPEVFWLEDMQARNDAAVEKLESLKKSPFRAPQGTAKPTDRGKFYDPSDHDAGPLQVVRPHR